MYADPCSQAESVAISINMQTPISFSTQAENLIGNVVQVHLTWWETGRKEAMTLDLRSHNGHCFDNTRSFSAVQKKRLNYNSLKLHLKSVASLRSCFCRYVRDFVCVLVVTARYYASPTKTMLPTRKSVPRSSWQSDHMKTS